ncbi:MAG: ABC transporter permease, partial [Planctomycetota bacterium]
MREAVASRVLAVAVIAICVVLILLCPLSLTIGASTGLRPYEVPDLQKLAERLVEESDKPTTPAAHIWSLLSEEHRKAFRTVASPEQTENARSNGRQVAGRSELLRPLNEAFAKPDFYNSGAFVSVELPDELKASDSGLSRDALSGRNLKRFAAAFKDVITLQSDTALSLNYGAIQIFGPLPVPPQQRDRLINEAIIVVLGLFLGFLGIFTSVIVTAAIIPRSLEPGEISLLLSKPIDRSVLFLTKFLGGCVFTLICAVLLVGGVWLILWLRMGLWKPELLLCVPLYIFLFAIYSSVSSLAGVIWRNTTVSLVVVVLFWILITTAGSVHDFMAYVNLPPKQIAEITTAGGRIFAMHRGRMFSRWDAEAGDWVSIL